MTYNEAILELVKIQDTMMVARNDNKRLEIKILPLHTIITIITTGIPKGVRSINMQHVANFEYIINSVKEDLQL